MERATSQYDCLDGCDALVIATEWNEFRTPDFSEITKRLNAPLIFDGRNLYRAGMMQELGFTYYSVGRPVVRAKVDSNAG